MGAAKFMDRHGAVEGKMASHQTDACMIVSLVLGYNYD